MPHKHKRKHEEDKSSFDLAPTSRAKPLPAYKVPSIFTSDKDGPSNKRRKPNASKGKENSQDDTPKQFARMMAWQAAGKVPSGLDNGDPKPKTKKKQPKSQPNSSAAEPNDTTSESTPNPPPPKQPNTQPKILPGESLSSFSIRVNQSLPLTTIPRSTTKPSMPGDIKPQTHLTKHNKRLQRLISDWRTTDAKLKSQAEEEESDLSDVDQEDTLWDGVRAARVDRKGKKKNSKVDKADDPWRELEKKRKKEGETKQKNLQDVVKAPPELKKVKSKFKVREEDYRGVDGRDAEVLGVDVKNVPNKVGSLRRREEMSSTRRKVIEGYRNLVKKSGGRQGMGFSKAITA